MTDSNPEERCGSDGDLALRTTLLPKDTNPAGTIFGGVILSLIDQAGEVAMRKINPHRRYVTIAMDSIKFIAPVFVGDLISLYTCKPEVGRTSVSVQVDVLVERRDRPGVEVIVTVAKVTYVAIGGDGKPIPVVG
ncbi:MAG: acyl-CoA thioesterase [Planctomycetota bacterium]|nr:MAG: acyl-CoA thioesterase [Planctomycetota bacterium]